MKTSIYKRQRRKIASQVLMAPEETVSSASRLKSKLKFLPRQMQPLHLGGGIKVPQRSCLTSQGSVYFLSIRINHS